MEIKATDPEFVRVWERVKKPAPAPEEVQAQDDWEEFLTGKIRAELERRRLYLALGLAAPARESYLRAKTLSAAWFFRSGQRFRPSGLGARTVYPTRDEAIRQLYHSEALSERDYLAAREGCGDELLEEVFAQCAEGCRRAKKSLWDMAAGR